MRLIAWKQLRDFYESPGHRAAEQPLRTWKATVRAATWLQPADVKRSFPQTDILKHGRAVFDIGGNKWRIVAGIDYISGIVFIKFVGTHAQYDRIDADLV